MRDQNVEKNRAKCQNYWRQGLKYQKSIWGISKTDKSSRMYICVWPRSATHMALRKDPTPRHWQKQQSNVILQNIQVEKSISCSLNQQTDRQTHGSTFKGDDWPVNPQVDSGRPSEFRLRQRPGGGALLTSHSESSPDAKKKKKTPEAAHRASYVRR